MVTNDSANAARTGQKQRDIQSEQDQRDQNKPAASESQNKSAAQTGSPGN